MFLFKWGPPNSDFILIICVTLIYKNLGRVTFNVGLLNNDFGNGIYVQIISCVT
jgi:hypothetical protein